MTSSGSFGTFGLSAAVIEKVRAVFQKHPTIEKAILYGSRAKGNFKPGSDIDLSLIAPDLKAGDLLKIDDELDELGLPYKIDLSLLHEISDPALLEHIRRVGTNFYERGSVFSTA